MIDATSSVPASAVPQVAAPGGPRGPQPADPAPPPVPRTDTAHISPQALALLESEQSGTG